MEEVLQHPWVKQHAAFDNVVVSFTKAIDANSFSTADVIVTGPAGSISASSVTQLSATQFRVNFTPSSGVGTYSYAVGPNVQDRIRSAKFTTTITTLGQNTYNAVSPQVPKTIVDGPAVPNRVTSTINVGGIPAGQVVTGATVNLTLRYPFTGDLVLTLIAPDGTQVLLVNERPGQFVGRLSSQLLVVVSLTKTSPSEPSGATLLR